METNPELDDQRMNEIIDKIKALFNKAASTDSTEEADTATLLAQKLLMKYNLDMTQIEMRTEAEKRKVNITEEYHHLQGQQKRHESEWVGKLYRTIARYNLCRAFYWGVTNSGVDYNPGYVCIVGEPFNVQIVKFIVEQVISKIRIIEAKAFAKYRGHLKRNSFKRGFFDGAVLGIGTKLEEDHQETQRKARQQDAESNNVLGMITTKGDAVMKYLKDQAEARVAESQRNEQELLAMMSPKDAEKYQKEKEKRAAHQASLKGRNTELKGQEARYQGYEAGKSIQINKGLNNNTSSGNLD